MVADLADAVGVERLDHGSCKRRGGFAGASIPVHGQTGDFAYANFES
jgi:hypothetical protein